MASRERYSPPPASFPGLEQVEPRSCRMRRTEASPVENEVARRLCGEQLQLAGASDGGVASGDAQLAKDAADVCTDGVHGHEHRARDLFGGQQLREQTEYLQLLV